MKAMNKLCGVLVALAAGLATTIANAMPVSIDMQVGGYGFMFGDGSSSSGNLFQASYISVRNNQGSGNGTDMQSVIRFDTSALSALVSAGDTLTINSASLNLHFIAHAGTPTNTTMHVGIGAVDTWSAGTTAATTLWNQSSEDLASKAFTASTPTGMYSFTLSGLDFADIGGDHMLTLLLSADQNVSTAFNELVFSVGASFNGGIGIAPRLVLDVSVTRNASVPEPATLALLGLGFLGAALVRRQRSA